jgi:16S rRNA (guanine527-N7)-methyltransferase
MSSSAPSETSSEGAVSRETTAVSFPEPPPLPDWLSPAAPSLAAYVHLLATAGVERGLLGPREVPRLWERHVLNCAVVARPGGLLPPGCTVLDIGSGAGLPGVVWAIVRPDCRVTLVEPLLRRTEFLQEVVRSLDLSDRVRVERGRAEDLAREADIVTARAVAPLARLAQWAMPAVRVGGSLLALKGERADAEVAEARDDLVAWGATDISVLTCGEGEIHPPTTVVRVLRGQRGARGSGPRRAGGPVGSRERPPRAPRAKGRHTRGREPGPQRKGS